MSHSYAYKVPSCRLADYRNADQGTYENGSGINASVDAMSNEACSGLANKVYDVFRGVARAYAFELATKRLTENPSKSLDASAFDLMI